MQIKTLLLFLCFSLFSFGSEKVPKPPLPESGLLTSLDADPSGMVGGCVNVISGEFVEHDVDLTIMGPEPLILERVLIGNNPNPMLKPVMDEPKWHFSDQAKVTFTRDDLRNDKHHSFDAAFYGPLGEYQYYKLYRKEKDAVVKSHVSAKMFVYGMTNSSKGVIGGQTNIRNSKITWDGEAGKCEIRQGDGTSLRFTKENSYHSDVGDRCYDYNLTEEKRPNFARIKQEYDARHQLVKRSLQNWGGVTCASYTVSREDRHSQLKVNYKTCDGRSVIYLFEDDRIHGHGESKRGKDAFLKSVTRSDAPSIEYEYHEGKLHHTKGHDFHEWPKLYKKKLPDSRFTQVEYYKLGGNTVLGHRYHVEKDSSQFARTSKILAPLGADPSPLCKYQFVYYLPRGPGKEGCTGVYDALNHKTDYAFNSRQRLTDVTKFFEDGTPYTRETLYYGPRDTPQEIELQARVFGVLSSPYKTFVKNFTYDDRGNIIEERLFGNLTGTKEQPLTVDGNGRAQGEALECLTKRHAYTRNQFNLLIETKEGEVTKRFSYIPETNLLSSCLHSNPQGIFLRHFYEIDDMGMVVCHIIDDGSGTDIHDLTGVTERKIERVERSRSYPFGLPCVVTETVLDLANQKEILLGKKVNTHDSLGRLIKQDTYGSDGAFAYSEEWAFDAHGNLLREVNPLGIATLREYDANDNLIFEEGPSLQKRFTYDFMNRLIQTEELHKDGTLFQHFRYDLVGNPVAQVDVFGNETRTTYDAFNRPISVEASKSKTIYAYDELSHPTEIIGPDGSATQFFHTLHGKPYKIIYPDNSSEHFEYNLQGTLVKETARNGVETHYTLDHLDRPLSIKVLSKEGALLYETTKVYNTFHLLEETDPLGNTTSYRFDPAGRLQSITKGDLVTLFEYDALSRLAKTTLTSLTHPKEGSVKRCAYDVMNHLIEESTESLDGQTLTSTRFGYDNEGRQVRIENDSSIREVVYDTHGVPSQTIDPLGNVTKVRLILDYFNDQGIRSYCLESIDPKGQITLSIQDSEGRVLESIKKSPFGEVIQKRAFTYNLAGHCTEVIETIYSGESSRDVISRREYDACNRMTALIQAAGSQDEKRVSISYLPSGEKQSVTKADGTTLLYSYDVFGRVFEKWASDNSVHYRYIYDAASNPIETQNLLDQTFTRKSYDLHQRVTEEQLANGLSVKMNYTPEGALKSLTLDDDSSIHYSYTGPLLKTVTRFDPDQNPTYTHSYEYDESGRVIVSKLIQNLGDLSYTYTKRDEIETISSLYYKENLTYDETGNLQKKSFVDARGREEEDFSYDALYQIQSESGRIPHSYTHDSSYNRLSKDGAIYNLNDLNEILSDGKTSYQYDLNGNRSGSSSSDENRLFTFDALDRLKTLQIGNVIQEYAYDDQNRLTSKKVFQNSTLLEEKKFLFAGANEIGIADSTGQIEILRVLGKGLGAEIGAAIALEIRGETFAPLHDHNGNVVTLINSSGTALETYRYSAFGEEELQGPSINPWRFSSKRQESGLTFFGLRFYDPAIGRFISPDPAGYTAGPNLYAFVGNNPLTHFDAYGLFEESTSRFWENVYSFVATSLQNSAEVLSSTFQAIKTGVNYMGTGVKLFSQHLIPIPLVKDIGCMMGHFLETGSLENYTPSYNANSDDFYSLGRAEVSSNTFSLCFNGIMTPFEDAKTSAEDISDAYGGANVHMLYNGTQGFVADILECIAQKLGIRTNCVEKAVAAIRYAIHQVGGVGNGGVVKIDAHSQGGIIVEQALRHLTSEEKAMLYVTTYGSGSLINDKDLMYVKNYVSGGDMISLIGDPIGYLAAKLGFRDNVKFVGSGYRGFEHGFRSTYNDAMNFEAREFKKRIQR